jgi:hypothetical protein
MKRNGIRFALFSHAHAKTMKQFFRFNFFALFRFVSLLLRYFSFLRLYFHAANPEPQSVISRVETKIFVFVFSRKVRKNLFSLFAKKAYEKLRKERKFSQKRKCMRKRTQETGNIVKYLMMSNPDGASKQIGQQ